MSPLAWIMDARLCRTERLAYAHDSPVSWLCPTMNLSWRILVAHLIGCMNRQHRSSGATSRFRPLIT